MTLTRYISVVALLFAMLVGCEKPAPTALEARVARVSLQPIPAYAPLWIAKEKGWLAAALKDQNLGTVEWSTMRDGPVQNEAFAAGQIDVALMGDTPAIIARSAGLDTRIVSIASYSPSSLAILVPNESAIRSPADLKGKKVGVTKGSFCHHLLALALKDAGLTLSDIQFINMAAPDINTSLQTKEIDAGVTWEPYITQLTGKGVARVLIDGTGLKRGDEVIVARHEFSTANPKVVEAILKVYQQGQAFITSNPDEAAGIVGKAVSLSPAEVKSTLAKTNFTPGLRDTDLAEFAKSEAFLRDLKLTRGPLEIGNLVDAQYAKSAGLQ